MMESQDLNIEVVRVFDWGFNGGLIVELKANKNLEYSPTYIMENKR